MNAAEGAKGTSSGTGRSGAGLLAPAPPASPPPEQLLAALPRGALGRDPPPRSSPHRAPFPSPACRRAGECRAAGAVLPPPRQPDAFGAAHASAPIAAWDRARPHRPARASRLPPRMRARPDPGGAALTGGRRGRKGDPAPRLAPALPRARPGARAGQQGCSAERPLAPPAVRPGLGAASSEHAPPGRPMRCGVGPATSHNCQTGAPGAGLQAQPDEDAPGLRRHRPNARVMASSACLTIRRA